MEKEIIDTLKLVHYPLSGDSIEDIESIKLLSKLIGCRVNIDLNYAFHGKYSTDQNVHYHPNSNMLEIFWGVSNRDPKITLDKLRELHRLCNPIISAWVNCNQEEKKDFLNYIGEQLL